MFSLAYHKTYNYKFWLYSNSASLYANNEYFNKTQCMINDCRKSTKTSTKLTGKLI